ncbi:putative P450 monooxygenase [Zymoseptoria tritici IPO323]|uniref:P450 monooxygenase n=1 Tax=Zymoseptoria tritici (strain CBS 115943 / IPO323) TaxID=336722 RepID=F9XLC2_ZYMTI|nr:putative P450 monooxygenase [Zymoseptoria tritici IPO323]EGP83779.1 putative P450 monooxygenase [Zymoseptoria tritici IPO323]
MSSLSTRDLAYGALFSLTWVVVVHVIWRIVHYRYYHPLRHYPGPWLASVTRMWLAWHHFWGTELHAQWALIKKHGIPGCSVPTILAGPVIRITPTMLLVADSKEMPIIFHRRDTKSRFYLQGYVGKSNSILLREPGAHAAHRRLIGAPYALANIQRTEPLLDKHILHWISTIDARYAALGKPVDFSHWSHFLAYDTITDLGFRNPLGFVKAGSDVGNLIGGFRIGMLMFGVAGRLYPFTEKLLNSWFKKWLVVRTEQQLGFAVVMEKAGAILAERRDRIKRGLKAEKGEGSYDLLQAFMDARTPDGDHLADDTIVSEIFVVLGAGSDAFGSASTAFMASILSRPTIFRRLMDELEDAIADGKLSYPVPSYAEVSQHLPYYAACIKETLRLDPSGATLLPREVCPGDPELILNGHVVPIGTEVAMNPWIAHRDVNLYGPDAEEYNPDRWLSDPARTKIYEKYNLAWGYGARLCLGKPFAMMELYKGPLSLLLNFDVTIAEIGPNTPAPHSEMYATVKVWGDVWLQLQRSDRWSSWSSLGKSHIPGEIEDRSGQDGETEVR